MQDDKLTRLLHRFATTAVAHYQALDAMDEERGNTHANLLMHSADRQNRSLNS